MNTQLFFTANMRRALTAQLLVSLIRELLPPRNKPAMSIKRLVAYIATNHPRITAVQIQGAIRLGVAMQQFVPSIDGLHLTKF